MTAPTTDTAQASPVPKQRPSDATLNHACMIASGWDLFKSYWFRSWEGRVQQRGMIGDFCTNANVLPELHAVLIAAGPRVQAAFSERLDDLTRIEEIGHLSQLAEIAEGIASDFAARTASPRTHVVAFLKSLGQWKDDWNEIEKQANEV